MRYTTAYILLSRKHTNKWQWPAERKIWYRVEERAVVSIKDQCERRWVPLALILTLKFPPSLGVLKFGEIPSDILSKHKPGVCFCLFAKWNFAANLEKAQKVEKQNSSFELNQDLLLSKPQCSSTACCCPTTLLDDYSAFSQNIALLFPSTFVNAIFC